MNRYFHRNLLAPLFCLLLISSCSAPRNSSQNSFNTQPQLTESEKVLTHLLYSQYRTWKGTPYREGGLSRKGVDCSGFVYLVFRNLLGIQLPRTTKDQEKIGRTISLHSLRPGDLIFFDTGWFIQHVGVYIENGRFLHSATSNGVSISSLDNPYWKDAFIKAKRLDIH